MANRSRALRAYHRQVREVVRQTKVSYADARRAVAALRQYNVRSAHATRQQPRAVKAAIEETKAPYASLQDYIDVWEDWEDDVYDDYDVETGVDY